MSNDNDTSILSFPSRMFSSKHYDLETDRLIHDAKIAWVKPLNQAAAGICAITEKEKNMIEGFNRLCFKYGHPPLISDEDLSKL